METHMPKVSQEGDTFVVKEIIGRNGALEANSVVEFSANQVVVTSGMKNGTSIITLSRPDFLITAIEAQNAGGQVTIKSAITYSEGGQSAQIKYSVNQKNQGMVGNTYSCGTEKLKSGQAFVYSVLAEAVKEVGAQFPQVARALNRELNGVTVDFSAKPELASPPAAPLARR